MPDQDCFNATAEYGGVSQHEQHSRRWPRRRTIWNCESAKGPLFTRYYLFESKLVSIYVHCFHTSDDDRNPHDHPWSFLTIPLSSGYWDVSRVYFTHDYEERREWVGRFRPRFRPATHRHIVILDKPNTWTLVFRFRRVRDWGFWTKTGWMQWQAYGKEWCD